MSIFTDEGAVTKLLNLDPGQEFRLPHNSIVYQLEREDGLYWHVSWYEADSEYSIHRKEGSMYIGQEVQRVKVKART